MANKTVFLALAMLLVACVATFLGVFYGVGRRKNGPMYFKAAVAADAGLCSEIGRDVLLREGTAVDASIAALLCVGVVNPHSAGIGGGHFFTIYDAKTGTTETIDARELAPRNATESMFGNSPDLSMTGGLAIAVPGEIRGYAMAHRRHGGLPWRDLFQPSIDLAEKGFPVGKALAAALDEKKAIITSDKALCEVFCRTEGGVLQEKDIIKCPKLAETYRKIAAEGPDVFYEGQMAQDLVTDIQAAGGIITMEDLRDYKPLLDEKPIRVEVGGYTMVVPNAPASGPVLALLFNILKGYNFTSDSTTSTKKKILTYHRVIEGFRFAYAERTLLGDPRFLNITEVIDNMTSPLFADALRSKITDDTTHPIIYYKPQFYLPEDSGTSHLSVLAEDGSAVAVTSTVNHYFGSTVMSRSTGIILNNEMDDFSSPANHSNGFGYDPSPHNFIRPGKRPLSSMCPTILFDKNNDVKMVVGGSGGSKIITAVAQMILKILFFDHDLREAMIDPRLHNQLSPNATEAEPGFDKRVLTGLALKNHEIKQRDSTGAVVQAVVRYDDGIQAESDPRKWSHAAGY
ncbi:glutathione hydrolase 1 proenzyme [Brachionichthys hirsutus]|uniref:glutathione hydrolase 1 proenzyme n=1 Tax=Brachionichthys hirsutus TaxID=412623 RepID=UPI0036044076